MIEHQFEYYKTSTVSQAIKLLGKHKFAVLLAGGTDLVCNIKENLYTPKCLIDIKGIKELTQIKMVKDDLHLGALVTFDQLIASPLIKKHFPLLQEMSEVVASKAIRNRATMVGNICSAVPCLDSAGPLLCYEAQVMVKGPTGQRKIDIDKWFKGPRKTALKKGEMVVGLKLKKIKHGGCYIKLGRYRGEDLAQASVTVVALPKKNYRVAFGSVAPAPLRAKKIERELKGKELDANLLEKAKELVKEEISPITDIRATKEYRMHMSQVMLVRALSAAQARLNGEGPAYGESLI